MNNNWYEVSIILKIKNKKIHILDTESLEIAEEKKKEFLNVGITAIIEVYTIKNDKAILEEVI